jgi:hypothetical protein
VEAPLRVAVAIGAGCTTQLSEMLNCGAGMGRVVVEEVEAAGVGWMDHTSVVRHVCK